MAAVLSGSVDIRVAGPEAAIYVMGEGREDYPRSLPSSPSGTALSWWAGSLMRTFQWEDLKGGQHVLPGRKRRRSPI